MARTPKTGLDYFPLYIDFFDDPKIAAVTVEHGTKGQAAVIMLLCHIYRNGYYVEWTPENSVTIIKELPSVNIKKMEKIVKTLVEWGFFDRNLFEQHQILTSRDIQEHYMIAARRRKNAPDNNMPYWLEENHGDKNNGDAETVNTAELLQAEMPIMSAEIPQEDNKKINNINPSPSSARAREIDINETVRQLKENESWMEVMCMKHHLDRTQLEQLIGEFATDCQCRGKGTHECISDAQSHFCNWLLIRQKQSSQQKQTTLTKPNNHGYNYQQRTSAEYIADAQQWAIEQTLQTLRTPKGRDGEVLGNFPF